MRPGLAAAGVVLACLGACVGLAASGGRAAGWAVVTTALLASVAASLLLLAAPAVPRARLLPALAIAAWGALGAVTLPGAVLERISPRRELVERATPRGPDGIASWAARLDARGRDVSAALSDEATAAPDLSPRLGPLRAAPASYAPWATRRASLVLLAFLLLLVAASTASERVLMPACALAVALALVTAVNGAWQSRARPGLAFGLLERGPNVTQLPYGPFWSLNHAAALMALALPLAIAAALDASLRAWLRVACGVAAVTLALGLLDAGSRGALLAAGLGVAGLGAALLRLPGRRAAGGVVVALAAAAVVLAFTVFAPRVLGQTFSEATAMSGSNLERSRIYATELKMAASSPLLGTGLGAFRTAHAVLRAEGGGTVPLHGESDWLETLAEGGAPLALLWLALLAVVFAAPLRAMARGEASPLRIGVTLGALVTLAHAAVDFHLREPAVAIPAILFAAASAAWARPGGEADPPARGPWRALAIVASLACAGALAWHAASEIPRDRAMRAADRLVEDGRPEAAAARLRAAAERSPDDGDTWAALGWAEEMQAQRARPGAARNAHRRAAVEASVRAIEASPAAMGAARRCASMLLAAGADDAAADAVRLALVVAPGQATSHRVAGQLLLRHGPSDEAVAHLAFAFNALPGPSIVVEGRTLAPWMLAASGGDAPKAMRLLADDGRVAAFVGGLAAAGEREAVAACVRDLAAHPRQADAGTDGLASVLMLATPADAAPLARVLLPNLRSPVARLRAGIALQRAGATDEALPVLRAAIAAGANTVEGWLSLAEAELADGRRDAALAALRDGALRHPAAQALARRLEQLQATP